MSIMSDCSMIILMLMSALWLCPGMELPELLDRKIIACHTTDFECFKRQYSALRDFVLMGCPPLGIEYYTPYHVQYGNSGTCITITGFEESQLSGISLESRTQHFGLALKLPFKITQQVLRSGLACEIPVTDFPPMARHTGPLKSFTGNATIRVVYPYMLKNRLGQMYMALGEESIEVSLNIGDLWPLESGTDEERLQYLEWEWAYDVVQHINAAEYFALPFTTRLHKFTERVPMERYLLLYPGEEYSAIHFRFSDNRNYSTQESELPIYETSS